MNNKEQQSIRELSIQLRLKRFLLARFIKVKKSKLSHDGAAILLYVCEFKRLPRISKRATISFLRKSGFLLETEVTARGKKELERFIIALFGEPELPSMAQNKGREATQKLHRELEEQLKYLDVLLSSVGLRSK